MCRAGNLCPRRYLQRRGKVCGRLLPHALICLGLVCLNQCTLLILNTTAKTLSQLASTTQDVAVITTSASSSGGNSHHLLSQLLSYTNHGKLLKFFNEQLLHLNPALARRTGFKIGSPSLARDEATGRAVLGVRVETPVTISSNGRIMFPMASSNFLMLCDLKFPIGSMKCQDSGIFPWAIPPQCSGARWFNPAASTFWLSYCWAGGCPLVL